MTKCVFHPGEYDNKNQATCSLLRTRLFSFKFQVLIVSGCGAVTSIEPGWLITPGHATRCAVRVYGEVQNHVTASEVCQNHDTENLFRGGARIWVGVGEGRRHFSNLNSFAATGKNRASAFLRTRDLGVG